jgi:hypothetical protein
MSSVLRRVLVGSMVALLLSVGTAAPTVASRSRTYVAKCTHVAFKPHSIIFACGDGGFYVKRLHWRHWSFRWAVATGVFHANDCDPDCARGTFHRRRGILLLTRRLSCPSTGKFVFRHVTVRYNVPPKDSFHWGHPDFREFCPM